VELVNEKFKSIEDFMVKYFTRVDKISVLSEKSKAYHHMVNLSQLKKASFHQRSQREALILDDALDEWTREENSLGRPMVREVLDEDGDHGDEDNHLLGLTQTDDKPVCHKKLLHGKCDGPCNYDHSPSKINSERERLVYNWKKEKEGENQVKVDPGATKILRRSNPGYQYPGEKAAGSRPKPQDVRLLDGMDENFLNLVAALFKTPTDAAAWRAAHRKAEASVDGKSFVSIGAALFDSGESSDN
jgi:hypothetical protein